MEAVANVGQERTVSHSSLPSRLDGPPDFFLLKPSFIPIFFHVLSLRLLGLRPWSLDGGVVGGVIGSPATGLDTGLPESSVKIGDPVSVLRLCPDDK